MLFAPKLWLAQLQAVASEQPVRVIVQGYVTKSLNNKTFYLADGIKNGQPTHEPIKVVGKYVEDVLELAQVGAYLEVTGMAKAPANKKGTTTPAAAAAPQPVMVTAHKILRFNDATERAALWAEDLAFLHSQVYPMLEKVPGVTAHKSLLEAQGQAS